MSKCPVCSRENVTLKAAVIRGEYLSERCEKCLDNAKHSSEFAAKWRRERMKEDHRRDLLQSWDGDKPNADFAREYPKRGFERFGSEFMERV